MLKTFTKNTKIQKFIATLMMVAILTPSIFFAVPPKKAEAQWYVFDGVNAVAWAKDLVGQAFKQAYSHIARKLTEKLTQGITKWVASGFSGNPFYLENPDSFFKDIVKYEVKNLVDTFAYNRTKFPFGREAVLSIINAYQSNLQSNTEYTLNRIVEDPRYRDKFPAGYLDSYRNDFNVGGWDGFFINSQYPQNNYLGFKMLAEEEAARKLDGTITTAAQKVNKTLDQAGGFLAPQSCADNDGANEYNKVIKNQFIRPTFDSAAWEKANPVTVCGQIIPSNSEQTNKDIVACIEGWNRRFQTAKDQWNEKNGCKNLVTTTPGTIVASQAKKALESKIDQANLGAAMGNAFATGFGLLIDSLIEKGLTKLTKTLESKLYQDAQGNAATVNYQPAPPASSPVAAEICQDIDLEGGGGGTDSNGKAVDLGFEGGGSACTKINAPSGPPPDFSEIGKYKANPGSTTTNPPTGGPCTGNNPKCTCAEGVATYNVYANAVGDAENRAYPGKSGPTDAGVTPAQAQAGVCAAYTGPGSCRPASQEDELIITGLPAPYVTLSVDFLADNPYKFWAHPVAACEAGVQ